MLIMWVAAGAATRVQPDAVSDTCNIPDAEIHADGSKRFLRTAATVGGLNLAVWGFDRFIQHGDFAYVTLNSIKENFRRGFIWDNDKMGTNMFLHPYHGNLYFNSARSNGYNFWRSGAFAVEGSAMWELFMECEYPSTNDIIATPIGGMALGEVAFRASDVLVDDRLSGNRRFTHELCIALISPMRGLTRLINGDSWRRRPVTGRSFPLPDVTLEYSAGLRALEFEDEIFDTGIGFTTRCFIEYGDRFSETSDTPYDYFTVRSNINIQASQPLLGQLNIMGRLASHAYEFRNRNYFSVGMYQHFDYYDSDTISDVSAKTPYKLGVPASFGCGVLYRDDPHKGWNFSADAHANAVILGAILSDYYMVDERNYNLASGFSLKGSASLEILGGRFRASARHEYYRLYSWRGYASDTDWDNYNPKTLNAQGDQSRASFNVTEVSARLRIWRSLYLTGMFSHYLRSTRYRDFPHVRSSTTSTSLMLTYVID